MLLRQLRETTACTAGVRAKRPHSKRASLWSIIFFEKPQSPNNDCDNDLKRSTATPTATRLSEHARLTIIKSKCTEPNHESARRSPPRSSDARHESVFAAQVFTNVCLMECDDSCRIQLAALLGRLCSDTETCRRWNQHRQRVLLMRSPSGTSAIE